VWDLVRATLVALRSVIMVITVIIPTLARRMAIMGLIGSWVVSSSVPARGMAGVAAGAEVGAGAGVAALDAIGTVTGGSVDEALTGGSVDEALTAASADGALRTVRTASGAESQTMDFTEAVASVGAATVGSTAVAADSTAVAVAADSTAVAAVGFTGVEAVTDKSGTTPRE